MDLEKGVNVVLFINLFKNDFFNKKIKNLRIYIILYYFKIFTN
jgi:hypothetical protein